MTLREGVMGTGLHKDVLPSSSRVNRSIGVMFYFSNKKKPGYLTTLTFYALAPKLGPVYPSEMSVNLPVYTVSSPLLCTTPIV